MLHPSTPVKNWHPPFKTYCLKNINEIFIVLKITNVHKQTNKQTNTQGIA